MTKSPIAPIAPDFWDLPGKLRAEKHSLREYAAPLAALIFLRWVDFRDSEDEATSAFDEIPYSPLLPIGIRWRRWQQLPPDDLHVFFSRTLPRAIEQMSDMHEPFGAILRRILPILRTFEEFSTSELSSLTDWLANQPFETPRDRWLLLERFDMLLDEIVDRDSGQYRTPSAIDDLLVALIAPAPGERMYDPCFGFGGILTAACKRFRTKTRSNFARSGAPELGVTGVEINVDAFAIGVARVALAGVVSPQLELGNSLERQASNDPKKNGFDIVICNPPWGGKVDARGMDHFPIQTTDNTSLFVQHALSQLHPDGRAAIVVPQGFLFQQGKAAALRHWILDHHRVDAVVSLPEGAFQPYTGIKAAILLLRRSGGPTVRVRMVEGSDYFEPRKDRDLIAILPEKIEELAGAVRDAMPGKKSWDAEAAPLVDLGYDLSVVRRDKSTLDFILEGLGKDIAVVSLKDVCSISGGISVNSADLEGGPAGENSMPYVRIGDLLQGQTGNVRSWVSPEKTVKLGPRNRLRAGDVLVSRSGTIGKVGIVRNGAVGGVASNGFFILTPDERRLDPHFLSAYIASSECASWLKSRSSGSVIQGLTKQFIEILPVPLPPLPVQHRVAADAREHGVDALVQLSLLLSQDTNDPIAAWIDQASRIEGSRPIGSDRSHSVRFQVFGEGYMVARNRAAKSNTPSPLSSWLTSLESVSESFRHSEGVPRGPSLLSILQRGASDLAAAERRIEGHTPLAARARQLTRYCEAQLSQAIEELLSEVGIAIESKTESLKAGTHSELTLLIRNEGLLPLRNFVIEVSAWKVRTKPIFIAEKAEQTLTVEVEVPASVGRQSINLEWTCAKLDGRPINGRQEVSIELTSSREISVATDLGLSPYFISQPVGPDRNDVFFGREAVIEQIKRQLQSGNTVLLEGNRRAGKSSILKHLEGRDRIPGRLAVYSSFQAATGAEKVAGMPTETVWRTLAQSLATGLLALKTEVPLPDGTQLKPGSTVGIAKACRNGISVDAPWEDFQDYLREVLNLLAAHDLGLVLMIDEFDKLQEGIDNGVTSPQIPENIRYLIQSQPRFAVVMTGSRRMQRLRHEYWSALFGLGNRVSVSALDKQSAQRLVTDPVKGRLIFTDEAGALVTSLTARQPFLIQYLCNRIFEFASHAGQRSITLSLVQEAAKAFVEDNEHFASLWDYAQTNRRRFLIALCHHESAGPDPLTFGVLHQRLGSEGIEVSDTELDADLKFLQELELIDFTGVDGGGVYRLTIPLMGKWLDSQQDYQALLAKALLEQENQQ